MSVDVDKVLERILLRDIDKQEAIQCFEGLSNVEKERLVQNLKRRVSVGEGESKGSGQLKDGGCALKALEQNEINEKHQKFIEKLADRYQNFVPKSKLIIEENQEYFVDQRRPFHLIKQLKEFHFQITYKKADGAYVYDIDGNRYIDISGDMGVNIFGHKPDFINEAIKESLDKGILLSGYPEGIFETAKLFTELTGHERVLFTQSGTEAVMWAVRIARAVTNKKKIVLFDGAYHGLSDAVTAFKDEKGESCSAGPGMLQEYADQLIILDYGNVNQLDIIEERADEIACVLIEPVQSRHPYIQPQKYLADIRKLTLENDIPLIFDEMITGFRICPKGAQGYFNIRADIATYGKIPGGGMPTGMIAGSAKYMDVIDGGVWNFGDDSMPKPKRALMAGTHSQNPLKIASTYATLSEIKKRSSISTTCDDCSCFQKDLNEKTKLMVDELNIFLAENNTPIVLDCFGSLFRFRFTDSYWGITESLFFILLRMNGVETNIQGNCFLTVRHTNKIIDSVIKAVKDSVKELLKENFFVERIVPSEFEMDVNKEIDSSFDRREAQSGELLTLEEGAQDEIKELLLFDLRNIEEEVC